MNIIVYIVMLCFAITNIISIVFLKDAQERIEDLESKVRYMRRQIGLYASALIAIDSSNNEEFNSLRDKLEELISINNDIARRYVLYREDAESIAARVKEMILKEKEAADED